MWDESKCNRDDKGRFAEKGSSGYSSEQLDRARQELDKHIKNYKSRVNLSKVEWKKFYNKIAEVQYGGDYETTSNGKTMITIEHENVHSIIVFNGDFDMPVVNKVIKIKDSQIEDYRGFLDMIKELL